MSLNNPSIQAKPERTKQQERAERILNVAEDLLLKHGYRRITIDDIAEQSGIGKGTIYLHWKSKEALFGTLFLREAVAIWTELFQRVRQDPEQVLFSRVMYAMMIIGLQRPLARAFFTWDRELLGKLVESGVGPRQQTEQVLGQGDFLQKLRSLGLIRADQDLALQSYSLQATITGFLMIEPGQSGGQSLSLEQRAEALEQTIHAAFEPGELPSSAQLKESADEMSGWLEQLITTFEAKILEPML
jgi:AcrR family transcriptional regulator